MSKEEEASSTESSTKDTSAPEKPAKRSASEKPPSSAEAEGKGLADKGLADKDAGAEDGARDERGEDDRDEDDGAPDDVPDDDVPDDVPDDAPEVPVKAAAKKSPPDAKPEKAAKASPASKEQARHAASKPHSAAPTELPPPAAGLGKSLFAFFAVMVLLASGFWILGTFDNPFGGGPPKWRVGQTVSVELTLDPADDAKLSCASEAVVAEKRCEYETKAKRHEKKLEDKDMLRPYSLADNSARLLAAGVWSAPELEKASRPKDRFNLKCDFKVDGEVKAPAVRWDVVGAWNEKDESWFAGSVTNCKLVK